MTDRVVLLGTKGGPAIRKGGPNPTSHLLIMEGRPIVVDCGIGVTRALVEADLALNQLDLIFITHLHSDHYLELGPLLHTAWTSGLATPVQIWGPEGIASYWASFVKAMEFDINLRVADEGRPDLRKLVTCHEFGPGTLDVSGVSVSALRVEHPPVTDCFALRFDTPGWSVVFGSDTAYFSPLADFARGADILIHEAMLMEGVDALCARTGNAERLKTHLLNSHTPLEQAVQLAESANVGQLLLNHLVPIDIPGHGPAEWKNAVSKLTSSVPVTLGMDGLSVERDK